jgi:hypothetical protein
LDRQNEKEDEEEEEVRPYYLHMATLRIKGTLEGADAPEVITETLALEPTHAHRRGDRRSPKAEPYSIDAWHYRAPVPREEPLDKHLLVLWEALRKHVDYLKAVKTRQNVDIHCSYRTNVHAAGFDVDFRALEIFRQLEVPFDLSITVPCYHVLGLAQEE